MAGLRDRMQLFRFLNVSAVGTAADYALAVLLGSGLGLASGVATTCGFVLGSIVNYCGHATFSFANSSRISVLGYLKYFLAVILSLVVRLAVVFALGQAAALPFWFVLLCAIGASFVTSYVIAALWIFRRSG